MTVACEHLSAIDAVMKRPSDVMVMVVVMMRSMHLKAVSLQMIHPNSLDQPNIRLVCVIKALKNVSSFYDASNYVDASNCVDGSKCLLLVALYSIHPAAGDDDDAYCVFFVHSEFFVRCCVLVDLNTKLINSFIHYAS